MVPAHAKYAQRAGEASARADSSGSERDTSQQKTVAVLGLGKTTKGDYLSSEDVELLETLGGYLGIAIQNGRLSSVRAMPPVCAGSP